ncbi:MAG: hypothetical protein KDB18_12900, partial [Salinibacterium sp.]|nr:hypothetical protein [Salinibacterium sp.]
APAKPGGELKMTRRPTDDLRFATPEAEFRSAVASSEPDEVPAIVWTDAAHSMIALDIEGQRVPLFVRMADTQDVCGQIRMQSRLAHIRHQGEGFRFETRDDFDLGSTHAALGHDGAAFAVEKTP